MYGDGNYYSPDGDKNYVTSAFRVLNEAAAKCTDDIDPKASAPPYGECLNMETEVQAALHGIVQHGLSRKAVLSGQPRPNVAPNIVE